MAAAKRVIVEITGWLFIALGILGLFLPFLQGILFILIGLTLLSVQHPWARKWFLHVLRRFPSAERGLRKLLGKYSKWIPGLEASAVRERDACCERDAC